MKIEFFNNFNNGDIHISREFIKDIIKKTNSSNVDYFHKNSERILLDIPEIKTQPKINNIDDHISYYKYYDRHPEVFLINTWYNSQPENYKKYSCTLKTLYENFKLIYSELGISIETEDFYIPSIDFSKYQIPQLLETSQYEKRIFISNCEAISGQSPQIYWDELIFDLTIKFPNYLFFITNPSFVKRNNCIHINKILNEQLDNNLCENAYISTICDVIIGNNSGPHTFSFIKENILGDKKQINIMCSYYPIFTELYNKEHKTFISLKNINSVEIMKFL